MPILSTSPQGTRVAPPAGGVSGGPPSSVPSSDPAARVRGARSASGGSRRQAPRRARVGPWYVPRCRRAP
eukprot:6275081-Lingulodinium_polyedra.AAC.1